MLTHELPHIFPLASAQERGTIPQCESSKLDGRVDANKYTGPAADGEINTNEIRWHYQSILGRMSSTAKD
ncbi:hypothetical protein PHLCEN_2v5354 [Hermanssonia centrifuga]|uniref:Uncharacterized protein n=1 Tax=Hermanssonia centrifuga TaxID=98765 RepID=A0A2R6P5E7_9APHY|nr:hypothetical protein PHLCEN_2v5354 [Hermanssonia centrifuga]